MKMQKILLAALVSCAVGSAFAADNFSENGSAGFGSWTITLTSGDGGQNGTFTGNSTGNGDGDGNADGDIGNPAWGFYANSGQTASGVRSFAGGPLAVGQSVLFSFDNGFIGNGAAAGVALRTSGGANVFEFLFVGGTANYAINDAGSTATTINFSDEGFDLVFTLTSATTYDLTIDGLGGVGAGFDQSFTGRTISGNIEQFRAFNNNSGSGGAANLFVNDLAVVPEPSTIVLGGLGLIGLVAARMRRRA